MPRNKPTIHTEAHKEFVSKVIKTARTERELVDAFNKKFNLKVTPHQMKYFRHQNDIKFFNYQKEEEYTDEQKKFVKYYGPGRSNSEFTEMFNDKFGTSKTEQQMSNIKRYLKVKSGTVGGIKKGSPGLRRLPTGTTKVRNGFTEIKVLQPDTWRLLHHLIWEEYNERPVPDDHIVVFKDGDRTNFDIENLLCVEKALTRHIFDYGNVDTVIKSTSELTKASLNLARVQIALNKLGRNEEIGPNYIEV